MWNRNRILIAILLVVPRAHAAPPVVRRTAVDCATLLTRGPDAVADDERARIVARAFAAEPASGEPPGVLAGAVRDLVDAGAITDARAQAVFAKPVLGEYAQIFRRYVIVELRSRGYADERVNYFLVNFARAYAPEGQVEFACAIARRMLATINDDAPTTTPRGLDQFEAAVRGFGTDEDTYARFLEAWRVLRRTPLDIMVRFVLAHVRAVGTAAEHDAKVRARGVPSAEPSSILDLLRRAWPRDTPAPEPPPATRRLIDAGPGPEFLRDDEALRLEPAPPPPVLERFRAGADHAHVERAVLAPPVARAFWWGFAVERANPAVLARIRSLPAFGALGDASRARADQLADVFARLERAATAIRVRAEADERAPARAPLDHEVVRAVGEDIARRLSPPAGRPDSELSAEITAAITGAFDAAFASGVALGAPEFLDLARRAFGLSLGAGRTRVTMAALHALMQISRGFRLDGVQRARLVRDFAMPLFRAKDGTVYPFGEFTHAKPLLVAAEWGARASESAQGHARAISPEVLALLDDVRAILPADERDLHTDRELLKAIEASR